MITRGPQLPLHLNPHSCRGWGKVEVLVILTAEKNFKIFHLKALHQHQTTCRCTAFYNGHVQIETLYEHLEPTGMSTLRAEQESTHVKCQSWKAAIPACTFPWWQYRTRTRSLPKSPGEADHQALIWDPDRKEKNGERLRVEISELARLSTALSTDQGTIHHGTHSTANTVQYPWQRDGVQHAKKAPVLWTTCFPSKLCKWLYM